MGAAIRRHLKSRAWGTLRGGEFARARLAAFAGKETDAARFGVAVAVAVSLRPVKFARAPTGAHRSSAPPVAALARYFAIVSEIPLGASLQRPVVSNYFFTVVPAVFGKLRERAKGFSAHALQRVVLGGPPQPYVHVVSLAGPTTRTDGFCPQPIKTCSFFKRCERDVELDEARKKR